jgi:threonine aldolase
MRRFSLSQVRCAYEKQSRRMQSTSESVVLDREQVQRSCTRFFGHPPKPLREQFLELAGSVASDEYADRYGGGALLESFEAEIAQMLGKEAAVFMPSGTMAQQIALRIHCEHRGINTVALHPQSHLVLHENGALARLHGLQAIPAGDRNSLYSAQDLEAIPERIGAVLLELPERNIGGALRPWNEVEAIAQWSRERGAALHLDGARIWETQPFYGMPLCGIAQPFETVYVSFYKILGAVAGAALAGPKAFIDEARGWQWRHGGRLVQQYPMIVSARLGLQRYLPRVPEYCARARAIAEILAQFENVSVTPNPPPTNMMHVYVRGPRERLRERALQISHETGIWMPAGWNTTPMPEWTMFELSCGDGSLDISDGDVRDVFGRLFADGDRAAG